MAASRTNTGSDEPGSSEPAFDAPGSSLPVATWLGCGPASPAAVPLPIAAARALVIVARSRSEEHTSELQSHSDLVCRLLLEKKNEDETGTCETDDERAYRPTPP